MNIEEFRETDGTLASTTSFGCYPILYYTADGLTICPACANKEGFDDEPTDADVYYEGGPIACDDCSKPIESAYGPVEETA